MTPSGMKKLQEELKRLISVERPKISQEIETARAHGDLRENAEYHAAKEKQGHIEGRIIDLQRWISNAEVIDPSKHADSDTVLFGTTVELIDQNSGNEVRYRIVGEVEADLKKRWISVTSPLARALVGKHKGDFAMVESPGGSKEYEIRSFYIDRNEE